ncbi:MAG: hypothetical protein RIE77_03110 [Phycisphaerales bacterium]
MCDAAEQSGQRRRLARTGNPGQYAVQFGAANQVSGQQVESQPTGGGSPEGSDGSGDQQAA